MIITYSKPVFKHMILTDQKIHTIREDKHNRWKSGMTMHHWLFNPRNTNRKDGLLPHQFYESNLILKEQISIQRVDSDICPSEMLVTLKQGKINRILDLDEVALLAKNDGLSIDQFRLWFVPPDNPIFNGWILHWTNMNYMDKLKIEQ